MGDMLIRDIPDPLKREIGKAAKASGQSLSATAVDLLQKGLIKKKEETSEVARSAWDALRSIFETHGAVSGEYAEIMDEIEAERKREFGRPVPDFE